MKLWKLYRRPDLPPDEERNPWETADPTVARFVVRAPSEEEARHLASRAAEAEDEQWVLNADQDGFHRERRWPSVWLDPDLSICEELFAEGRAGIVLKGVWPE